MELKKIDNVKRKPELIEATKQPKITYKKNLDHS